MTLFRFVTLILCIATSTQVQAATPNKASPTSWEESRNSLYLRLHKLPPFEQKVMLLVVYTDTNKNSKSLDISSPDKTTEALKVLSVEHRLLADLAVEVRWIEMEKWFRGNSESLVNVVNGKKTLRQYQSETEHNKVKYQKLVSDFQAQNSSIERGSPSNSFNLLRTELATYISATARIYVWDRKN